ncbi:nucleic-acid-binding protein from transposon X-element [Caerostris extrusa]|uniref:Nucleic-acid-binding protein from transposon X-element n=1 Tax=Caerostris extrusa TaxID=172846 RepID=A0AAV4XUX8_CAEEX|nr:nucleic-acid-binding protein from transposon X-element [Caerostris extrusa]
MWHSEPCPGSSKENVPPPEQHGPSSPVKKNPKYHETTGIDEVVAGITRCISVAAEKSIPKSVGKLPKFIKPWWNDECAKAYKDQKRAWDRFRRIPVNNKFANIEEETTSNAQAKETDDYSPTKPPPIMLALTANYTHSLHEIHRKFPKTENKLTKGYIKIFPDTEDSYRKIITNLTNAKYEYYIIRPRNEIPLKIVVKGLPIDTNIDEIKHQPEDLKFSINKIAQLKKFLNQRTTTHFSG